MSDGPYKSLPLRKPWKDVCEYAYKDAYTLQETADAMCAALHDDITRDVGKAPLNAMGTVLLENAQGNLLSSEASVELENIRSFYPASSLFDATIEHTQLALHNGFTGEEALEIGIKNASIDNARANIRAAEEHCHREARNKSEQIKAVNVRDNLEATLQTTRINSDFSRDAIKRIRGEKISTKLEKASGIDAGPVMA